MHALSSEEILRAWELGAAARPVDRPIAILVAAGGDLGELSRLPLGVRDARLLALRARTFGPTLELYLECPACGEQLELALEAAALAEGPDALATTHVVAIGEREVEVRLLDSRDLSRAAELDDVDAASAFLFESSILAVRPAGPLDEAERTQLAEALAELDPRADVILDALCPGCEHTWPAAFDPGNFVFTEVTLAARRLFEQVATLARAFGWTEREVLSLSPARRRAYLEIADTAAADAP